MRKIFITGDAGMLGNAISNIFKFDFEILTFPELETYTNQYHFYKGNKVKKSEIDITNKENLKKVFEQLDENSIVIHCAAYVNTDKCEQFSYEAVMSNVIGTQNIVEQCKLKNCFLINFSTTAVFDPEYYMKHSSGVFNETAKIFPKTIYGATKYAAELAAKQALEKVVTVKPVFIYGNFPYDNSSNLMKILKVVRNNDDKIDITLNRNYLKNYMHVDYFSLMFNEIVYNIEKFVGKDVIISRPSKFGKSFEEWLKDISIVLEVPLKKVMGKINLLEDKDYLMNHLGESETFYKICPDFKLPKLASDDIYNIKKQLNSLINYDKS